MFSLHLQATTAKELQEQIAAFAAPFSAPALALSDVSPDQLLAELRQRFAAQGLVVRVVKFDATEEHSGNAETVNLVPAQVEKKTRAPRVPKAPTAPVQATEEPKTVNPASDTAKAMAEQAATADTVEESDVPPSIEDVKAALNAYAMAKGGIIAARAAMKEKTGSDKLMEVPTDAYRELIEALRVTH